ncbi:L-threonylcarbamoyladenylate synthase [Desulfobacula phenolica]|uniref:L-threonylcarbamoyladenylate synthase n=1 Tax=Desulfobacula phenolica TaxID=90732 RepID=A0A1H2FFL3_9BACT|nr:L-threonylcarbamoyladenylate synthase [Desulfobacula phenolica]SDU05758.1 L-threonylcarbamoyladenylate synthase [Desulfobacula phenolica]
MHDANKIIAVDPVNPEPENIIKAGKILRNNGVVIFPAKCLYGIAARALDEKAVKKVFDLKQRPLNNPILVLIPYRAMLKDLVKSISKPAEKLMDTFWPGNMTLVFEAKNNIPTLLTADTGKIGVRLPVHPVARALVELMGVPLTGTSANLSGQAGCSRADRLNTAVIDQADLVLDAGILKGGAGSTIVDVTGSNIHIIREGEVTADQIKKILTN